MDEMFMPNFSSGFTIKSTVATQAEQISKLSKRLQSLEDKFQDIQDFLDYKGITKEEFEDFKESRKLADTMIQDQYEFPNIKFKFDVTPVVPMDHIVLKYDFKFDADEELDEK